MEVPGKAGAYPDSSTWRGRPCDLSCRAIRARTRGLGAASSVGPTLTIRRVPLLDFLPPLQIHRLEGQRQTASMLPTFDQATPQSIVEEGPAAALDMLACLHSKSQRF